MRERHGRRRTLSWIAATAAVAGSLVAVACVIADPPAGIPTQNILRPYILQEQVVPPPVILTTWPGQFEIPIEVPDPSVPVQWEAFLDYDPVSNPLVYERGTLSAADSDDGGIRWLEQIISKPVDVTACHTLEVMVALTFVENHTPDSTGGDSVTWFYAPSGSLQGCPLFDAGPPDAAAASDAAEASVFIPPPADDGGEQ